MSATYSTSLPTALDHVRFLIGDTDVDRAVLSDEEITAVLQQAINSKAVEAARPYLAAADCLAAIRARYAAKSGGVVEKKVKDLTLRFGAGEQDFNTSIDGRIRELRLQAASFGPQRIFRSVGRSGRARTGYGCY